MTDESRPGLSRLVLRPIPGVHILPVVHERVAFAALARVVLDAIDPAGVAVELPTTLAEPAARAVARLPRVSIVLSEPGNEDALVWVVTPGDPLVEAMRWAQERARPCILIDPDVPYPDRHRDPLPDVNVLWELGPERYLHVVGQIAQASHRGDNDALREKGMAHHVLAAARRFDGPILCLVGAMHAPRLAEALLRPTSPVLARQRRDRIDLRHLHPSSLTALLQDPPLLHAVHELLRADLPPPCPPLDRTVPRRVDLVESSLRLVSAGPHADYPDRRLEVAAWAAHHAVRPGPGGGPVPDLAALGTEVWRLAAAAYGEQTRRELVPWQRRLFFEFARRYARVQGQLVPGLYEWIVAGRGVADDNLAWEVLETARTYPWQDETAELETARIDGDSLDLGTRKIRFRRRFLRVKQRLVPVGLRRPPRPRDPASWLRGFASFEVCSYPPEDLVLEDYGHFLQRKAVSILSAELERSEPFAGSLLDGIDIRQTMRRWHEGRVWVHESRRAPGEAGSVVIIFDPDPDGSAYPYLSTWHGEHDQESDMAFYATEPAEHVVGPGILRATHGGLMLTYPPGRVIDVWRDPDYQEARSKPEVLLMAAIDYSEHELVVHAAPSPPSSRMHDLAAHLGKRIVHVPIGSLSPSALARLRVVHILAGREARAEAPNYIF